VSSSVSRTAPDWTVSPTSRTPPGRLHRPLFGSVPRFTRRTSPSRNTMAPTAGTGRFGNSFDEGTVKSRSGPGPSTLRPCGGEEIEIVEGPLVQDVTQDVADADVPLHRDIQASPKVRERLRQRRERARVPARAREHNGEEAVSEADCLVHADLVEKRERLHALAEFFPDGVVDGGDRPSRRHELAVLLEAERPDAERALDSRDGRAPAVQ